MSWLRELQPHLHRNRPLRVFHTSIRDYPFHGEPRPAYRRSFPVATFNVMLSVKNFLEIHDPQYFYNHNCVTIESNGLVDPYHRDPDKGC